MKILCENYTGEILVLFKDIMMQSYLPMTLDKMFQEDWVRNAGEDPRVFISLKVNFESMC